MITKFKNQVYRFLRKTQKYTGTDNVYLAKGGFWLTLGQVITAIAYFLLAIVFANLLDPTTYGNYKYVLSLVEILGIFSLAGIEIAVTQAVARGLEGSFYTGFKTKLKWGALGSLVAIGGAIYYLLRGNHLLPIPLLISAIFLPLMMASQAYRGFLMGKKLFDIGTKYDIIGQILFVGTMVITLFLTKNLFWLIAAYFVSRTFLNYFFYFLVKRKFQPNKKEDPQTLTYGKHLSLMEAMGTVANQLDRVLLFTFIGPIQLAVYQFALIVPDEIRNITKNISALALPKFSAKSSQEIKANMKPKFWKLFFLATVVITIYFVAAPYIYKIFFPKYLNSIFYSRIYIFSLLTLPFSLIPVSFQAKARKKELYFLQMMPFVQIILLVCLIPFFGIMGALTAVLGTKVLSMVVTLLLFRKF